MEKTKRGFEIEVLSQPHAEVAVPVPGGCNSSSNSSCSNDAAEQVGTGVS